MVRLFSSPNTCRLTKQLFQDDFHRSLRRTVMRYVNLSIVLVFRMVSRKVHNRFPSYQSLIDANLLRKIEAERLRKVDERTPHESTWTPILWALKLIQKARTEGKVIIEAPIYANLIGSFDYIEQCNRKILSYGWVNFPLAYTQVANLSVISYFVASLFACQFLQPSKESIGNNNLFPFTNVSVAEGPPFDKHTPDIYLPIYTVLEFISYMGWIKVAETLLNPFGDDDEDFEINYLIDRNVQVSYLIVDQADMDMEVIDPFLEAGIEVPAELPYKDNALREVSSKLVSQVSQISMNTDVSGGPDAQKFSLRRRAHRKISSMLTSPNPFVRRRDNRMEGGSVVSGISESTLGARNSMFDNFGYYGETEDDSSVVTVIADARGSVVSSNQMMAPPSSAPLPSRRKSTVSEAGMSVCTNAQFSDIEEETADRTPTPDSESVESRVC
jgi:hypothetical protein